MKHIKLAYRAAHNDEDYIRSLSYILIKKLQENKVKKLGEGAFRVTFLLNESLVIKVPHDNFNDCVDGVHSNIVEYLLYRQMKGKYLAKCKLFYLNEVPVIVMERINRSKSGRKSRKFLDFVKTLDDGNYQYGHTITKTGKKIFKVYDYGNEDFLLVNLTKAQINSVLNAPQLPPKLTKLLLGKRK